MKKEILILIIVGILIFSGLAMAGVTTLTFNQTTVENQPPYPPTITGPTQGYPGIEYNFTVVTIDPEGDYIWFYIDWGDGTNTSWLGPYASGEEVIVSHVWNDNGSYDIKARAKDFWGYSYWAHYWIAIGNIAPYAPTITGPIFGEPGVEYEYKFKAIDYDGDEIFYYVDWGDGTYEDWFGPYPSGKEVTKTHAWSLAGDYDIKAKAKDIYDNEGDWSDPFVVRIGNQPPNKPTITGPTHGKVGVEYEYTFNSTDDDGDDFCYLVDWGDGSPTEIVCPPFNPEGSGGVGKANHSWDTKGAYIIRAKAQDTYGAISGWGTLLVTMPVNQQSSQQSSSMPSSQNVRSVVPSTKNIVEDTPACSYIKDAVVISQKLSVRGHIAYALDIYSTIYSGFYYFLLNDPGNLTFIGELGGPNFLSGGTWTNDGRWLCCYIYSGVLVEVDPENGASGIIGGGGANLNGLACNPLNSKLYGAGDTALYLINSDTGAQELVGSYGDGVQYMIGIAFDSAGVLYGWDIVQDKLWTIDTTSGTATAVGSLGINLNYAQDGDFDRNNDDILYLAAFTLSPNYGGYLYTCDKTSGACTLVGAFEGSAELDAFAIPYNWSGPTTDFTWTPNLPNPGETTFFNASASYDPNGYIVLYQWDWDNDGIFDENHTYPTATHSWSDRGYYPVTLEVTDNASLKGMKTKTVRVGNRPPEPPIITGPTHGKVGIEYKYKFSLSDPDDDSMYLRVDWGNGTPSPWQGPYQSDMTVWLGHTWNQKGNFTIRAQAKDIYGVESNWSTLIVTMPVNQQGKPQSINNQNLLSNLLLQQMVKTNK